MNPTTADKLSTLHRIAARFASEGITWAAGASLMLYLRGRVPSFHDLDLMIAEPQALQAKALLMEMGCLLPEKPNDRYQTRHFYEFVIDGAEIDLIAGYVILHEGIAHECPLLPEDIELFEYEDGTVLPLHSLRAWHNYYTLMGRPDKAALCESARPEVGDDVLRACADAELAAPDAKA